MGCSPTKGLSVDGGTSGNPGDCFYQIVDIANGKQMFYEELGFGTNNIAEFLALVRCIHYCDTNNLQTVIWSDSMTALAWLKNKAVKSTCSNKVLMGRVTKAVNYLKNSKYKYDVRKWNTREWGEIPADFGRK